MIAGLALITSWAIDRTNCYETRMMLLSSIIGLALMTDDVVRCQFLAHHLPAHPQKSLVNLAKRNVSYVEFGLLDDITNSLALPLRLFVLRNRPGIPILLDNVCVCYQKFSNIIRL